MDAANIRTATEDSEHEYRLYREWYERKEEPENCCLSALAVPAATLGCLLVTLLLGGAL